MHTVKVFTHSLVSYLKAFISDLFMFCSFYSWGGFNRCIFNWILWLTEVGVWSVPFWRKGLGWMYRSSWEQGGVCSGACSRTVDTDRKEDRSDLTWQDVLWHDMLIWQQTQALLHPTNPRTYIFLSFISFWLFPPILSFLIYPSLSLSPSFHLCHPPSPASSPLSNWLSLPHPPYLPTPSAKAELVL